VAATIVALAIAAVGGGACTSGGGSTKAFCNTLRSGDNPLDVFDRYDPTNVSTARDQLQRGVDRLQALEQAAPSQLHADLQQLVDVGTKVVKALDPAAGGQTPPDFTADFQRIRDASTAVTGFAANQCGVDLQSAAPGAVPPGSG
jgi:hypothetical protein